MTLKVIPVKYPKAMRMKGLEPSRPKTPEPKSGASTNSATSACVRNDKYHNRYKPESKPLAKISQSSFKHVANIIKNYKIFAVCLDLALAKHS